MGKRKMDSELHRIKLETGTVYQTSKGGNYYFRYQINGERKCVISEHNLNAQSYLDDSFAEMNSLQNEITWHWGGEYVKAEKVCYRKRSSEVLAYKSIYSYPNLYSEDGSIDLKRSI